MSKQYFLTDAHCKSHQAFGGASGAGHDCGAAEQREAQSAKGPWWDDYSTPAYPGTHAQPGSHVHGDYDESGDMTDMFAGHTLSDDGDGPHSRGGEIVVAAGLGSAATVGQIVMMGGYGLKTSSGSVTVKSVNAGESGVSGELTFSSGTTTDGNTGYIAIGTTYSEAKVITFSTEVAPDNSNGPSCLVFDVAGITLFLRSFPAHTSINRNAVV